MTEIRTGRNVFEAAVARIKQEYLEGNRLIVTISGGKDSTIMLECAAIAARETGCLPVEVMFRDDEILYPETVDYLLRTAARKDLNFHWIVNHQAAPNIFNRKEPFYWCFDPQLPPSDWVRSYPPFAEIDTEMINLYNMVNSQKYPPPPGKKTVSLVGIRTEESRHRHFAILSNKGAKSTAAKDPNFLALYPIYDWKVGDVWRAVKEFGWDYNRSYDILYKMGLPKRKQRLSQIAMAVSSMAALKVASQAWPRWFDKVCDRLPGIRTVTNFGERSLRPIKFLSETWEECFWRSCVNDAPRWIADRSTYAYNRVVRMHSKHSSEPIPDVVDCGGCQMSYKRLAWSLFHGDPFRVEIMWLPDVEPSLFRQSETRHWPKSQKRPKAKVVPNVG